MRNMLRLTIALHLKWLLGCDLARRSASGSNIRFPPIRDQRQVTLQRSGTMRTASIGLGLARIISIASWISSES